MAIDAVTVSAGGDADTVFNADIAQQASKSEVEEPLLAKTSATSNSEITAVAQESPKEHDSETSASSPISTISSCDSFPTVPESFGASTKTVSSAPPSSETSPIAHPREVRSATEADLSWLLKSKCVLTPIQRYDAISLVHMVSPSMFMAVSHFGNEKPVIGRFLAIQEAISEFMKKKKPLQVPFVKLGMHALVMYEREYARAVLLSESKIRPNFLRFACLDAHAVIEVPSSDVFTIPNLFHPAVLPCNLFLARIHGVGPIKKRVVEKYFERFNCQESPITTVCAIRTILHSCHEIDFVLDDQWISETLLAQKDATPVTGLTALRKPRRTEEWRKGSSVISSALPSPTVVRSVVQAMIAVGSYDFPPNASIHDQAGICLIRPEIYTGYDVVLKKICPDSPLLCQKTIAEPKIAKEARLETEEKVPSPDVETERARDPWNDEQAVQGKLNILKTELVKIRAGTTAETNVLLSELILTAVKISFHPDSVWTQQLAALADEFRSTAISSNPI